MSWPLQDMAAGRTCFPQSSSTAAAIPLSRGGATSGTACRPVVDHAQVRDVANCAGDCNRDQLTPSRPMDWSGSGDLVREFRNFKKSAPPLRVLLFVGGAWNDLPPVVVDALRESFVVGRPIVEASVGESRCLFDFARMMQIDLATAEKKPVAWIDVNGRCFFPRIPTGGDPTLKTDGRNDNNADAAPSEKPLEEHCDENRPAVSLDRPNWEGLQVLNERDKPYRILERIFLAGMRRSSPATRITSIRRCCNGGASRSSRLRIFQLWAEMTRAARGTANVKYGWYGAAPAVIATVVRHGFGQPNNRAVCPAAQAVGVYIAPPYFPHASALMSDPDVDGGERHVVLCRVILGSAEKVDTGSRRCEPTGDEFDSGVDDLEKPNWYIVWGTRMNTHILPEYVVSFKTSEAAGRRTTTRGEVVQRRTPTSTPAGGDMHVAFPALLAELGKSLPSSRVEAMETLYSHLQVGKINRDVFLRRLRTVAGDDLMVALKRFQCHIS